MQPFHYLVKNDYDQKVALGGESVLCYSGKRLKKLCTDVDPASLYEARLYSEKEKKKRGKDGVSKYEKQIAGEMTVAKQTLGVAPAGTNSKLCYSRVGFVCTSEGNHVALCKSRLPFLLILLALLVALALATVLLVTQLGPKEPPVIVPDHPLPPIDTDLVPEEPDKEPDKEPDEDPNKEPTTPSSNGGGSVSMTYTLSANLTLSTGEIAMYFQNPSASNHSVALEFYIISDGVEYLAATSGLIPAGNGLYTLTLDENAPKLLEGLYEGLYRVIYYHPLTGVRANVESSISDVTVTVRP